MSLNVLLVEDEVDLARGLIDYLKLEGIDCDYAGNGRAGLELASSARYQVIILDINLPKLNGLEVCESLRKLGNDTPVLMLTARDTKQDKLQGFDVGTDDYLVKPFDTDELVARVRALAKRRSAQVKSLRVGDLVLDLSQKSLRRDGQLIEVTPIGWQITEALMRASPEVVSREELEQLIWHGEPPDTNALKVHLFRLRQKVDKPFSQPLIHTVPNHGLAMRVDYES